MSDITIRVNDNGPYKVEGTVKLIDADGNEFQHKEKFYLCRCGLSSNKPFCDGTHGKQGFQDASRAK
ncbi:CDGSH iron-sulfur domain-containing protein [Alicyclobacillus fodiniaquatilis]|jgi:CDGSH-type Zn-finger protein|uniref:CDGSH iron-sulfur domain-containing protein n=1 Tax=Alicyclobacillus fodiniaquatilis TaxID=1661150 RepID=A0ABW4JKM6_9BACL